MSLILAILIELSQLNHAHCISSFRQTFIGHVTFGQGFQFSDIVCYAIGISISTFTWLIYYNKNYQSRKMKYYLEYSILAFIYTFVRL
ncbi:MAG: DUF2809 domain-containing protein [Bacteroidota bacterium]|nr:DUF2809 domain-containing protein [Bacteroidota bacterium]